MTKGQKITMWVFGLIIASIVSIYGLNMKDQYGTPVTNGFVAFILPVIMIGLLFFFSFNKKAKDN
jgi:uncharacterized protein YacL